jgi:hypothetical protein
MLPLSRLAVAALLLGAATPAAAQPRTPPGITLQDERVRSGDMILERSQFVRGDGDPGVFSQMLGAINFQAYVADPWPNGVLPLVFDATVSAGLRARVLGSCRTWEAGSNVRCVEHTAEERYVVVSAVEDEGCSASVGRPRRRNGTMNLADGCWRSDDSPLLHELGHAFGLFHEHQRVDRDDYVTIDLSNVLEGHESNFDKLPTTTLITPYDFDSLMHYEDRTFARDPSRRVIEPRPEFAAQARRMGLATQPSVLDRQALALVYNAGGATTLRFDTQEIHRTMLRLDALYTTELKRPNGLSTGGEPDFAGVATWIFNVYLSARAGGLNESDAFYNVQALISQSEEWRARNPLARSFNPKTVVSTWRLDTGEYLAVMYRLSDLYRVELKRPEGLAIDGRPDFSGLATWVVQVYMNARLAGTSSDDAWSEVVAHIRASDEWHQKNPAL